MYEFMMHEPIAVLAIVVIGAALMLAWAILTPIGPTRELPEPRSNVTRLPRSRPFDHEVDT